MYKRLYELFSGLTRAYGVLELPHEPWRRESSGKIIGSRNYTAHKPYTEECWKAHLEGRYGLGVFPIQDGNLTTWGAIDIDTYGSQLDLGALLKCLKRADEQGFLLHAFQSKSSGIHLYCFVSSPVTATDMRWKLQDWASGLGLSKFCSHGKSLEIFPKQDSISEKDFGNYINMPFFKGTERCAIDREGAIIPLERWLDIPNKAMDPDVFYALVPYVEEAHDLTGAPPCLQAHFAQGVTNGTKNETLFQYTVYLKKRYPDDWQPRVEAWAKTLQDTTGSMLTYSEIRSCIKGASQKDYKYRCKQDLWKSFCNPKKCKKCEYGIVETDKEAPVEVLEMENLVKWVSEPPLWFLSVKKHRVQFATDQLFNQSAFRRRCAEACNVFPPVLKENVFQSLMQGLLDKVEEIHPPPECTKDGILQDSLRDFLGSRPVAKSPEKLQEGLLYVEGDLVHFRLKSWELFTKRQGLAYSATELTAFLKQHKALERSITYNKRAYVAFSVPLDQWCVGHKDIPPF